MRKSAIKEYGYITASSILVAFGVYFFVFTNNFCFGGLVSLAVILAKIVPFSPSTINLIFSGILLIFGFLFLGREFGAKTIYASLLVSLTLSFFNHFCPIKKPLTNDPMLEFIFAIALQSVGLAILFHFDSSSGGTDVIAMILKKHSSINIGRALFLSDFVIVFSTCFIFDRKTALFSLLGLFTKSFFINNVIKNIDLSKYFSIVCSDPDEICDFIVHKMNRSATVCEAKGAFTHQNKFVILTAMKRRQASQLKKFVRQLDPEAFMISNTSEIVGKGF